MALIEKIKYNSFLTLFKLETHLKMCENMSMFFLSKFYNVFVTILTFTLYFHYAI